MCWSETGIASASPRSNSTWLHVVTCKHPRGHWARSGRSPDASDGTRSSPPRQRRTLRRCSGTTPKAIAFVSGQPPERERDANRTNTNLEPSRDESAGAAAGRGGELLPRQLRPLAQDRALVPREPGGIPGLVRDRPRTRAAPL